MLCYHAPTPVQKLKETASKWGNSYRFRYYADGKRVSRAEFDRCFRALGCTPENGKPMRAERYGFSKSWNFG